MFKKQKCGSLAACICPKLPLFPLLRDLCGISPHILLCVSQYGAKGVVLGIDPGLCLVLVTGHSNKKNKKLCSLMSAQKILAQSFWGPVVRPKVSCECPKVIGKWYFPTVARPAHGVGPAVCHPLSPGCVSSLSGWATFGAQTPREQPCAPEQS